jgi:hypothetical protein
LSIILKPLLALVISILLFLGISYLANIDLLEFVQTRFYNPSVLKTFVNENSIDADITANHINDLQKRFEAELADPAIRSSFLYNQSAENIFERSRRFGILMETTVGLQAVQFIDSNGVRLHYSTSPHDIIAQSISSTSYRNYNEDPLALPYEIINVPSGSSAKYTMDEQTDRIIFSFPFNDSLDVYRGTAIFTVSVRAIADRLITEGRLKINENISVVGDPPGILLGSPHNLSIGTAGSQSSRKDILEKVSAIWKTEIEERSLSIPAPFTASSLAVNLNSVTIEAGDSGVRFSLISERTNDGMFFGRLVNYYLFSIPESMKLVLNLSIYITFYLTLFFMFNLKPNAVMIVQNRIKHLRESLFEHLFINKTVQERAKWILELEQRREEIRSELKRNLKFKPKLEKNINGIIDKSWDELLSVLKSGGAHYAPGVLPATQQKVIKTDDALDEIEEIVEAESEDTLEEFEEAEAIDEVTARGRIEEVHEIDDLEEIHDVDEIEELTEHQTEWSDLEEFKGLLSKAIAVNKKGSISYKTSQTRRSGLLRLAENIGRKAKKRGLLALAESKEQEKKSTELEDFIPVSRGKGLLNKASEFEPKEDIFTETVKKHEILLHEVVEGQEPEFVIQEDDEQDLFADISIVSPFSSMFSSLEEKR